MMICRWNPATRSSSLITERPRTRYYGAETSSIFARVVFPLPQILLDAEKFINHYRYLRAVCPPLYRPHHPLCAPCHTGYNRLQQLRPLPDLRHQRSVQVV